MRGDSQVTVRLQARPTATNEWAKAGLMLRESLEPGARNVGLFATSAHGLVRQWRPMPDAETSDITPERLHTALKIPMLLRLTRRGNTISAAVSRDGGQSFQPAGEPMTFDQPLPPTLSVGLAITSHHPARTSEARFSGFDIRGL